MEPLIRRAIRELVAVLCERELLQLAEGRTVDDVVAEVIERIAAAPIGSAAGPFIARALIESPYVDELYADDTQVTEILSAVQP